MMNTALDMYFESPQEFQAELRMTTQDPGGQYSFIEVKDICPRKREDKIKGRTLANPQTNV